VARVRIPLGVWLRLLPAASAAAGRAAAAAAARFTSAEVRRVGRRGRRWFRHHIHVSASWRLQKITSRSTVVAQPYTRRAVARLRQLAAGPVLGLELGIVALWIASASVLSLVTARVADWNAMTDELVYERLAISIGQAHSILPRLHG